MNKLLITIIALMGVLVLTACGNNTPNPSSDNNNASPSDTPKVLEPLTIALDWTPNTNHTGLYVALEQGYFAKQGFDVQIVQPSEDSASTLVAMQKADLGVYFQPNMVKRLKRGEPIVAIAAITQSNTAGLLSLQSLGAKNPKDLHGKRYLTWEDAVDDKTVAALVGEPLVPIPGETTDAATGLRLNQFDYILSFYAWDAINAQLKGVPTNFFYLKDYNPAFDYYSPVLIANSDVAPKQADKYRRALTAIKQGYTFAAQNPKQSAQILLKHAPEINPDLAFASQAYLSAYYLDKQGDWGRFDYERWDRFFTWVYDNQLVAEPFAKQAGVSNDYLPQ